MRDAVFDIALGDKEYKLVSGGKTVVAAVGRTVAQTAVGPTTYFWPGLIARNALFLIIVLAHGFGRLFRPR